MYRISKILNTRKRGLKDVFLPVNNHRQQHPAILQRLLLLLLFEKLVGGVNLLGGFLHRNRVEKRKPVKPLWAESFSRVRVSPFKILRNWARQPVGKS